MTGGLRRSLDDRLRRILAPRPPGDGPLGDPSRAAERNARAVRTTVVGFANRIAGIAVSILSVPLLLNYLGVEFYGVWLTITAAATWLTLVQLGVAPSLLNRLAPLDHDSVSERRTLISSAWWTELLLAGTGLVVLVVLYNLASWHQLFNLPPGESARHAQTVTAVVLVGLGVSLPTTIPVAALRASQEGYTASIAEMGGALLRLAAIVAAVQVDAGVVALAVGYTAAGVIPGLALTAYVFVRRFPQTRPSVAHFDLRTCWSLVRTGIGFSFLAIAGLAIWYTDVIVITQVLGPRSVPPYGIAFATLQALVGMQMVVLDAAWPGYAESAARRDVAWIRITHRRVVILLVASSLAYAACMALLGQSIIRVWAGPQAIPPHGLLLVLGLLAIAQAVQLPHGRLLTALGQVRLNAQVGLLGLAINLPLSVLFAGWFGITGVAAATLIAYLLVGTIFIVKARRAVDALADSPSALLVTQLRRPSSTGSR